MISFKTIHWGAYALLTATLAATSLLFDETLFKSAWLISLWALSAVLLTIVILRRRMWRRVGSFLMHMSFIIMLSGALTTMISGKRGSIDIIPGTATNEYVDEESYVQMLPFTIELDSIIRNFHPDGLTPSSYECILTIDGTKHTLSNNGIIEHNGYIFSQKLIDDHSDTAIIGVNHDKAGTMLFFSGAILFVIASVWIMISKMARRKVPTVAAIILLSISTLQANASTMPIETTNALSSNELSVGQSASGSNGIAIESVHHTSAIKAAYDGINFHAAFFIMAFAIGLLSLRQTIVNRKISKWLIRLSWVAIAFQLTGYALRWMIYGHIPFATTSDTMTLLSAATAALTIIMARRSDELTFALGMTASGIIGLIASLSQSSPEASHLPVSLASPWLAIHVSLVIMSYTLFVFAFIISMAGLTNRRQAPRLAETLKTVLLPAVLLLGMGILTGSAWALSAWGRYWGWDPKETWALITFMTYAVPLHGSIRWFDNPRHLFAYNSLAIITVIMTYIGVNYMPSLHSYGG